MILLITSFFLMAALYWFRGTNQGFCFHNLHYSRSPYLIGALECTKCRRIQYPEKMAFIKIYRAVGRVHEEKNS